VACDVLTRAAGLGGEAATDLQVWVSTNYDCTVAVNRAAVNVPESGCVQLPSNYDASGNFTVYSQDVVRSILGSAVCNTPAPGGNTGPFAFAIYFMLLPGGAGDAAPGESYNWTQTQIDLWPPPAVTGTTVEGGAAELVVGLPVDTDSTTQGYYIFCYPVEDGGAPDAGGSMDTCPGGAAIPAADLTLTSPYVCGSQVRSTVTQANVTSVGTAPLQGDTTYAVAVAAYDEVYNLGPTSTPAVCGEVQPTGSTGSGCGIRQAGAGTDPRWPVLGAAALAALVGLARRDRSRRRRRQG
jgi:hypothetical protein